jgi:ribosomal protein S18 acetylase RimI-like enzyme
MIEKHFEHAIEHGCKYVLGLTTSKNEAMIRSYDKNGYQQITSLPQELIGGINIYRINGKLTYVIDKKLQTLYFILGTLCHS